MSIAVAQPIKCLELARVRNERIESKILQKRVGGLVDGKYYYKIEIYVYMKVD